MFGYIRPSKPWLRVYELEEYKGVYCSLCKDLGRRYGQLSRMTLSYDFAFLAMLHLALAEEEPSFEAQHCIIHPIKKNLCCLGGAPVSLCSDIAVLMVYYKLLDNIADSGFFASLPYRLSWPAAARLRKKAARRQPEADEIIRRCMERQRQLEQANTASVDLASEPTAEAMGGICALLSADAAQKRVLERFGYFLGRYIYLIDALDDLEEDAASHGYNPFLLRDGEHSPQVLRENARGSLYLTIAELAKCYELLTLRRFKPVLDNILYLGMKEVTQQILQKKENPHD